MRQRAIEPPHVLREPGSVGSSDADLSPRRSVVPVAPSSIYRRASLILSLIVCAGSFHKSTSARGGSKPNAASAIPLVHDISTALAITMAVMIHRLAAIVLIRGSCMAKSVLRLVSR